MYKEYRVFFKNLETGVEKSDTFTAKDPKEARIDFRECYRHGKYEITKVELV